MTLNDVANGQQCPPTLVYVTGSTCCGKSLYLNHARKMQGVGFVEVGNEFRRRYPAGHFQGQSNPAHCKAEVLEIYTEFVHRELLNDDRRIIFVDGQPRTRDQVKPILDSFPDCPKTFLIFDAPFEVRRDRARRRHPIGSEASLLALDRLITDYSGCYETLVELLKCGQDVRVFDSNQTEEAEEAFCASVDLWLQEAL